MGELGSGIFVAVEKLSPDISSTFPQVHSKKHRVPLSPESGEVALLMLLKPRRVPHCLPVAEVL